MLFFLRKLIEAVFLPSGLFCLLALIGAVWRRRWLVVASILLLIVFATPLVTRLVLYPLERVYPTQSVDSAPMADAIVVLSGGIIRGQSPAGVQWGPDSNRYWSGLALARAGRARFLVLSSGTPPVTSGPRQNEILRNVSLAEGISPDRILTTRYVFTTEDEAAAISALPGIHSILLVTSAFHLPRAVLLFRARGLEVTPFPTDQRVLGTERFGAFSFLPGPDSLRETELAIREYYGLAIYRSLFLLRPPKIRN